MNKWYAMTWIAFWLALAVGCVAENYKTATIQSECIKKTGDKECRK